MYDHAWKRGVKSSSDLIAICPCQIKTQSHEGYVLRGNPRHKCTVHFPNLFHLRANPSYLPRNCCSALRQVPDEFAPESDLENIFHTVVQCRKAEIPFFIFTSNILRCSPRSLIAICSACFHACTVSGSNEFSNPI